MNFEFVSPTKTIRIGNKIFDGRRFLRSLEVETRQETGLLQVTYEFPPDKNFPTESTIDYLIEPVQVEYHENSGYIVTWSPLLLINPEKEQETRKQVVSSIKSHAKINNVEPSLDFLPGKVIKINQNIDLDPEKYLYDYIVNDGGVIVLFFIEIAKGQYFMLKQVLPLGVVWIQFTNDAEYEKHLTSFQLDCSSILKLEGDTEKLLSDIYKFNKNKNQFLER